MAKNNATKTEEPTLDAPAPEAPAQAATDAALTSDQQANLDVMAAKAASVADSKAQAALDAEAQAQATIDADARFAELQSQIADLQGQLASTTAALASLADRTGKDVPPTAMLRLRSDALSLDLARDRMQSYWPQDGGPAPVPNAKTFLVTPVGTYAGKLPQAVVENCSDGADAKAAYYKALKLDGFGYSLKIEPAAAATVAA